MSSSNNTPHPQWATKYRTKGTELRNIKGNYYLYEYKTVYDAVRKRAKKVSGRLLGRITEKEGLVDSSKLKLHRQLERIKSAETKMETELSLKVGGHREFGVSEYILSKFSYFLDRLKQFFPADWQLIALIVYCRWLYQCPIKNMPMLMMQSWLYEQWQPGTVSDRKISDILRSLGHSREQVVAYMKSFISGGSYVLVDTTHILSQSSQIELAKKGYNSKMDFEPQISTMYLFSASNKTPLFYRINPGNIREVKAFRLTLKESGITDAVLIGDKGFHSKDNVELLDTERLQFILPLIRTHELIDYASIANYSIKNEKQYFMHQGHIIWYKVLSDNRQSETTEKEKNQYHKMICLFLDEGLRNREERDYLAGIDKAYDGYSWEKYQEKKTAMGTMTISSSLQKTTTPQAVYETYKTRLEIEEMFDTLKTMLRADATYMQNEEALQGWMFINHIALQWCHQTYAQLSEMNLLAKYSVKDLQQLLKEIRQVNINGTWYKAESTKATLKLEASLISNNYKKKNK